MDDKKEWSESERNEHFQMIKKKLKNKKVKDNLEKHISEVQKIFECPINISLSFDEFDRYTDQISDREEFFTEKKMLLSEFVSFLKSEDQSLYVNIDPIYLNDGINEIKNILLTSMDDKLIIIPQID